LSVIYWEISIISRSCCNLRSITVNKY